MSLINQALKKEQQRRSLNLRDSIPDIPTYGSEDSENSLTSSARKNNRSLSVLLGFTGVGVLLLALGGGFIYFGKSYLSQFRAPQMVSRTEDKGSFAAVSENPPIATVTQILEEIEGESSSASANSGDTSEDPNPESDRSVQSETAASRNADSAILEEPIGVENPETDISAEPEFDFKIQDLIDEMQVLGFRSAGPNSRLLMNGRVFKLEDIIDNERGLRFLGSDGENLVFEAPSGYRYRKPL